MIQRIQTVFLFLSAVFAGILFFTPIASFALGNEIVTFTIFGVEITLNFNSKVLLKFLGWFNLATGCVG